MRIRHRLQASILLLACNLATFLNGSSALAESAPILLLGGRIKVASDVPAAQTTLLAKDLAYLEKLQISAGDDLRHILESEGNPGPEELEGWLADRVQYVVSENMDPEGDAEQVSTDFAFPNPGIFPELRPAAGTAQLAPSVIMRNIGSNIYLNGKLSGNLLGLRVPGVGLVPVPSPRVGLIQIGQGMFLPMLGGTSAPISSPAYSLYRLSVLFHEARHSDGNGRSTGFLHAYCPAGHDYEGTAACDLALNGAYAVGAEILRDLTAACSDCGTDEKEALKLKVLDNFHRVLQQGTRYIEEGRDLAICQALTKNRLPVNNELSRQCQVVLSKPVEMVPASEWDPLPEGSR
jgi:hypothetical protein